jgi:tetratricopeptide (TPR) repeat protein
LHGYWYGSDTLHTPRQLNQPRPRLKASLASLIKGVTLIVSGYGGWDDTFAEALMEVVLDDAAYPEIIWTFNAEQPEPAHALLERLGPGIDRGRVSLYSGIDCNVFFPQLLEKWHAIEIPVPQFTPPPKSSLIHPFIDSSELAKLIAAGGRKGAEARIIEGDEEDRPPVADVYVGRENELKQIALSDHRVFFVTGIGGQGKSTLVAQYFALAQRENRFDYYIWRDCKEEGERFENQIISLIEKLSHGAISGADVSQQSIEVLTELLLKNAADKKLIFVFDNVDHYVDLELNRMTGSIDRFINAFLARQTESKVFFTCRPFIQYENSAVQSLKLEGLDLISAIELFTKRQANSDRKEIEDAHRLTVGHAFWLDLWAAQVAKSSPNLTLRSLLDQVGAGALPTSTLDSIWKTLNEREKLVLRSLAETVRPETEGRIGDYLRNQINFNRVMRALRSLRSLNLIVVKSRAGSEDVLELHPLIREYVRRTFPKKDRLSFIDVIISFYSGMMGVYKVEVKHRPSLSILRHWTENAELSIEAGKLDSAFESLAEVGSPFSVGDYPGEFARVAKLLFQNLQWEDYENYKNFDVVFSYYFSILVKFGRSAEYMPLLAKYEATVQSKNARFVNYCNLQTYMNWVNREYSKAVEWGLRGKELKDRSNVDTQFSTDHNLALAQRDAGAIDPALAFFLGGKRLDEITDVDELDENRKGQYYGNIGRCLHLMGQIDPALICYRKSAILLEKDQSLNNTENKAFARKWIGELLIIKSQFCLAKTFLDASKLKWEIVSPPRVAETDRILNSIREKTSDCDELIGEDLERFCIAWIFGRESEFRPLEGKDPVG